MLSPYDFSTFESSANQLVRSLHHLPVITVGTNLPSYSDVVVLPEETKEEVEICDGLDLLPAFDDVNLDANLDFELPSSLQQLMRPAVESLQEGAIVEIVPLSSSGMASANFFG